jgi:hypothetical protein
MGRFVLALFVFALDLHALLAVRAAGLNRRVRYKWTFLIVALPVVGVGLWWRRGSQDRPGHLP